LAALLEKTGTGKDAIELKKRKRLAQQRLTQQQANREEALMQGRFVGQAESTVADFPLPKWCPVLIVIPKSVAEGWMTTFSEWGHFSVTLYDGPNRSEAIHSVIHGISEIMICSMAMLSRKEDFKLISSCKWKLVVVDEFHQFKNERGHLSTNLRSLKQQRQCVVIGLTGTVMQNDHKELWNLVDLAAKDFLGSWSQFEAQYAKPIKLAR
jgi:SNF2 family DNA or RNA helicase